MNPETTHIPTVVSLQDVIERTPAPAHAHATAWTAAVLRRAMNDGALVPGSKLVESRLAEALDISRNTLRQAFMVLTAENLVEQIPNRGVFVKSPDAIAIGELFTVRLALESTAIELAAPGRRQELHDIIDWAKRARENGSVSEMALANQEFHRVIVAASESQRLMKLMSAVLAEMRLLFFAKVTMPSFHGAFVDRNERLMNLVEAGETALAQEELREYLAASRDYFAEQP